MFLSGIQPLYFCTQDKLKYPTIPKMNDSDKLSEPKTKPIFGSSYTTVELFGILNIQQVLIVYVLCMLVSCYRWVRTCYMPVG